jgi:ligand-binding sensor domain-containing protein
MLSSQNVDREKHMESVIEKIKQSSWRVRILWALGILIVSSAITSTIYTNSFQNERNNGWNPFSAINSKLPDTTISKIKFDQSGKAWLATRKGIYIYDGEDMKTYLSDPLQGEIKELAIDPQGRIWVGLYEGVSFFDGETWTTYSKSNSILPALYSVVAIAFDPAGSAWLGTHQGIIILDGTTWSALNEENAGLPDDYVKDIAFDHAGHAWIGTDKGVIVFDGETWTTHLKQKNVNTIAIDPIGKVWVGTHRGGAWVFDSENWTSIRRENYGFSGDSVEAIAFDQEGRTLLLAENDLRILDDDEWITYNSQNSGLVPHTNSYVAIDPEGQFWISSYNGIQVAEVDSSGLPHKITQEHIIHHRDSFLNWANMFLPIISTTILWIAILIWDIGIPLAFLLSGLTWLILELFGIGSNAYATAFFPIPIFLGGVFGAIVGGIIRKVADRGKLVSVITTVIGAILGALFGYFIMFAYWIGY